MSEIEDLCKDSSEILEAAKEATSNLLPTKSREKYLKCYQSFFKWRAGKQVEGVNENIMLAFFFEKAKSLKASSIWSTYSMLKSTLQVNEGIDISKYRQLIAFLKKQNEDYEPKKSKVLTSEHILKFLNEAPNEFFLLTKVVIIFALNGACRSEELRSLTVDDIVQTESMIIVTLWNTKTKKKRVFTVTSEANGIELYKVYHKLRPKNVNHRRFFIGYRNGKCTIQPVGINTFYGMPKKIAEYLGLPEASSYTGHCMRRTSATMLVDNGGSISDLKRLGGWTSSTSAEGYIEDSIQNKIQISKKIFNDLNKKSISEQQPSTSTASISNSLNSNNDFLSIGAERGVSFNNLTNCTFNFYDNKSIE